MIYTTPGVYFEQVDRSRPAIGTLRTDVAAFIGYTERGPMGAAGEHPFVPVRLNSWRHFLAVFGEPLTFGYLGEAVRGFYENGGAVCYVVRIANPDRAQAASVTLMNAAGTAVLRLTASHGALNDPTAGRPLVIDGKPVRRDSPGGWGNRLAVEVLDAAIGFASAEPPQTPEGATTRVDSLKGFQAGSLVRFIQQGKDQQAFRLVKSIEPHLLEIAWDRPLAAPDLDLSLPFRMETREFSLRVLLDGQIVERHDNLSLVQGHKGYVVDVVEAASLYLDADLLIDAATVGNESLWPLATEPLALGGGRDGLSTLNRSHYLGGPEYWGALDELRLVDEVSLLAAPDLVVDAQPPPRSEAPERAVCCEDLEPPPKGLITGLVVTLADDGGEEPVAGVAITPISAATASTKSAADGTFVLNGLPEGQVTLRLERANFHLLETTAHARTGATDTSTFTLAPISLPPALSLDDIAAVQQEMALQGEDHLYRVAVLDPPANQLKLDAIQTWRRRFDTAFAALYYPWVVVSGVDGPRLVPPCGHVAGLIARTDLSQGVHRAPASYELEGVQALSNPLNEIEHGILNEQGINALRAIPGRGIRVQGARTLSSDTEWTFLNVRRLVLMIEEAVEDANQWAVFEPNNPLLRQILGHNLRQFLDTLWRQGALAGSTADAAYVVKCDVDNNPPSVVDAGQLIAEIGVAPAIPFEFIRFRLGRTVGAIAVTE